MADTDKLLNAAGKASSTIDKKYEMTEETRVPDNMNCTLHRIRALRDIWFGNKCVRAGDLGGFIEEEGNLSHYKTSWVADNAMVYDGAEVCSDAYVSGNAKVYGHSVVTGKARVYDNAKVSDHAKISDGAAIFGNAVVSGVLIQDNAMVHGDARVCNVKISGLADICFGASISPYNQQ